MKPSKRRHFWLAALYGWFFLTVGLHTHEEASLSEHEEHISHESCHKGHDLYVQEACHEDTFCVLCECVWHQSQVLAFAGSHLLQDRVRLQVPCVGAVWGTDLRARSPPSHT